MPTPCTQAFIHMFVKLLEVGDNSASAERAIKLLGVNFNREFGLWLAACFSNLTFDRQHSLNF